MLNARRSLQRTRQGKYSECIGLRGESRSLTEAFALIDSVAE
jgi:hypothetical protein